jgi:proliferating cell nuclear antigen
MMDSHRHILIDMELLCDNFNIYRYRGEGQLYLGINLSHMNRLLKSIKKKDSIIFVLDDAKPNDLVIKVIPKENSRVVTSVIKIQTIQNLDISLPEGYGKPITIPSAEFQKMCKELNNMGTCIQVNSKNSRINFLSNMGNVYSREVSFGEEKEKEEKEEDNSSSTEFDYSEEYNTEQFLRIIKLSGLSNGIAIHTKKNLPLFFKSAIGSLGKLSIYVKCKKQIEKDDIDDLNSDNDEETTS